MSGSQIICFASSINNVQYTTELNLNISRYRSDKLNFI